MSVTDIILLAVLAAFVAWNLARYKGLSAWRWALGCFLFAPALIALVFVKSRRRASDAPAFQQRWPTLVAYHPDIKAATERLAALGPSAVEQFRIAYADVQTKESIPLIVEDIERRLLRGRA